MDFKNKAKMSLEDFRLYIDDDDFEFAYGTIDFLSTKPNSHKHVYSEDVIKEYAPSILGKWVIGEYKDGDMTSHTMNQVIQGRVPENQEVQYRYDEDGYLIASVDIVLSKLYSNAYKVLKEDNFRNVSIEELLGFTPETETIVDGMGEKIVIGFHVCAVTILGKDINGSIPNANIQLVKMSEDNAQTIDMEYAKYSEMKKDLKDDNNILIILNKLEEISNKLENNKEEIMAKNAEITKYAVSIGDDLWGKIYNALKEKYPKVYGDDWIASKYRIVGIYEEGAEKFVIVQDCDEDKKFKIMFTLTEEEFSLGDDLVEVKVDFVEIGQMEMFTKEDFEKYEEEIKPVVPVEPEPEVMGCGEDKEKMAEVEAKLAEAEAKIATYEAQIEELKEFKNGVEVAKCQEIVKSTLDVAKKVVDEAKYDEFVKQSEECVYATVDAWSDKVLASISKMAIAKMEEINAREKEEGILDIGMPVPTKNNKKESIYD